MKKGFTLIELLLVISIISILSAFSISGTQRLLHGRSHNNVHHQLKSTLYIAQSNSQNAGFTTVACPSSDSLSCNLNSDWSDGWLVYNDLNDDKDLDNNESIILVRKIANNLISINFNALGNGEKIVFYPSGRLWPNGNFVICHNNLFNKFKITTTLSGRIQFDESELFLCD